MSVERRKPVVAQLSSVHPWDDNRVFGRHCRSLARHGYRVTLVAADTDTGTAPEPFDDVQVVVQTRPSGRVSRVFVQVPRVLVAAWRIRADVYHLHDPELAPLIPILRARPARVVFDAHEDLPSQLLDKHYLPGPARRMFATAARLLCGFIDRTADHVVAATPTIAERFTAERCTVVHNYPTILEGVDDAVDYDARDTAIVYVGAMSGARGATEMVDALGLAELPGGWSLRLVGSYSPMELRDTLAARAGWARVDEVGQVSKRRARELISTARVGLILFQPTRAHVDALPTKMFEYMAAGVPVIASDFPLWRRIVTEAGCGLLVDPADPAAIARAMGRLASHPNEARAMGERGRAAVLARLNWGREEEELLAVYRRWA